MRYLPTPGKRALRVALAVALALGAALACAACAPAVTSVTSVSPPPRIGYDCGTFERGGPGSSGPAQCLLDHYVHCEAATLVYDTKDADVTDTHTITVKPQGQGGACTVTDSVVTYVAVNGGTSRQDYQCTGVQESQGPLTLTSSGPQRLPSGVVVTDCGLEGSVALLVLPPPKTPLLIGTSCGWVRVVNGQMSDGSTSAEACLWHAYLTCGAATLDFDGDATSAMPNFTLVLTVLPQTNACALYVQVTDHQLLNLRDSQYLFICNTLVRQGNGLEVPTCKDVDVADGARFGVFLPAQ